ncbi:MAG: lysophospholipid acyltransferase family protein [Bacteroidota bacterium]|nr:lysophospholipid acyltransferase family protein [Bacteroidota bacterium]
MQKLTYYLFRVFGALFRLIPFWLLYRISDFLYFILYKVFGYRKAVVQTNLTKSFPEKEEKELKQIERKFYKFLADIFLEGIKGFSMSKEQLIKRYKVLNPELLDKYRKKGRSVIAYASHYGNWEWGVLCLSLQFKYKSVGFYKPLSNRYIDKHLRKTRAAWGMSLVPIKDTSKAFEEYKKSSVIFFMIADQSPQRPEVSHNINFLGRDTLFLHGPAKYAKQYNYPAVYGEVTRVKRGYYTITIKPVSEEPTKSEEIQITELAARILERSIGKEPSYWLWSHKRWKHSVGKTKK